MSSSDFDRRHEQMRAEAEEHFRRAAKLAVAGWVIGALVSTAVLAVAVWAVIRVVVHFTS
jgi:hypothetical protein